MSIFLSKFINKVDKKGRVSVPSSYRNILSSENFSGIIVYRSFKNNCLEASSMSHLVKISQLIEELDPYSEERDAFETIILGGSIQLQFDSEGRVMLPQHLIDSCSIDNEICFVGKGSVFEMWQPAAFDEYSKHAAQVAAQNRYLLKSPKTLVNIEKRKDRNEEK